MIKLDAIKWLIEHVTKWPTYEHGIVTAPDGWRWCKTMLGMELVKDEPTEMYADMHIIQQEWLDGTDDTGTINIDDECPGDSTCVDQGCPHHYATPPTNGATKFDDDKPMMHLVPLISVEAVAKVMTFGAKKYAPNGWKSVPNAVDRYNSAMLRHMVAIQKGETIDPDSGLPHIDHIACNAMFLSYFHNNGNQS